MELKQLTIPEKGEEIVIMTTSMGDIKIKLFPEIAPKAVENFKTHINNKYYDGLIFHRVIPDFMIQGGDPEGTGRGGKSIWGRPFEDEFNMEYRNFRGALSMANAGPNTNGSQFFLVQTDRVDSSIIQQMKDAGQENGYPENVVAKYEELGGAYWLDFKHTVFGQVFEGLDIVDEISNVKRDRQDRPLEDVKIEKMTIVVKE